MMKDNLGDRMKGAYEDRTRYKLPRRGYTIIRIDGKAFHTYTKGLERPFDKGLIKDMNLTAAHLCKNIMGCKLAYVQSDEISLVLTDFDTHETQAWFDNNIQKMVSIAAAMATAKFNQLRMLRKSTESDGEHPPMDLLTTYEIDKINFAMFDARVFQVPTKNEAINYLIWRQQDAVRNSIQLVAQSHYSHKELHKKNTSELQDMIHDKGDNWNDYSPRQKRGSVIRKITEIYEYTPISADIMEDGNMSMRGEGKSRTKWEEDSKTPIFTKDREYLEKIIPLNE